MIRDETLYLLRRQRAGAGGAEKVARRFRSALRGQFEVRLLSAGDRIDGVRIAGARGPGWWRALRYTFSVERFLATREGARTLSFERGPRCEIYRAGDGVHRRWIALKYGSSSRWRINPHHWVAPRLERRTMKAGAVIVANSQMVARDIAEYYPEFAEKVRVVYNGFEPEVYHPADGDAGALREALGLPGDGRLLLFVGSGWERKGLEDAIGFLARCREEEGLRLVVVGRGRPENYRRRIRELGLEGRVRFAGVVADTAPFFQAAQLHVLPTRYDPFSNSCLEALACGCPVLTTRGNGVAEIIQEGRTGFVLPEKSGAQEWAQAGAWWAGFRGERASIAASVSRFTSDAEMEQYRALFWPGEDKNRAGA